MWNSLNEKYNGLIYLNTTYEKQIKHTSSPLFRIIMTHYRCASKLYL